MTFCEFIKEIDFFGKEPEFYIKGKPKKVTLLGRIFTIIFIIIYIIIFCYKLYRMFERVDITFYDSYLSTEEAPKVKLTQDNFTLVFAILDENGLSFIDGTVYYPLAFYYDGKKEEEVTIEVCDKNKVSQEYVDFFGESELEHYYCLTGINYSFRPLIEYLRIEIYPCQDSYEGNNFCELPEIIEEKLSDKIFMIYFQDIMLTPLNYSNPVKNKINSLNTQIYKNLGQYLYAEMQMVKIETSRNIIGFDFLTEPKSEEFIKFDNEVIFPYPGSSLDNGYSPMSIFELRINDRILLENRHYVQLIDALGEIGGFMDIFFSFLTLICSLFVDKSYEQKITNNLFSFDIKHKLILIKKGKNSMFKINKDNNKEINKDKNIEEQNPLKTNNYSYINTQRKRKVLIFQKKRKNLNNIKNKNDSALKIDKIEENPFKTENNIDNENIKTIKNNPVYINQNGTQTLSNIRKAYKADIENETIMIIRKIKLKDLFFSMFCCFIKRKKVYNLLVNESMNVVQEKLDIFNIFRNIFLIENTNNYLNDNSNTIKMSDELSKILIDIMK